MTHDNVLISDGVSSPIAAILMLNIGKIYYVSDYRAKMSIFV